MIASTSDPLRSASLRSNLIANYLGQGWTALINVALIPVYIRALGVESYALVGLYTVVVACFTLLDAGMSPTLNREMARHLAGELSRMAAADLLRSIELVSFAVATCVVVAGWLCAPWLSVHWLGHSTLDPGTTRTALALIVGVSACRICEGIYRGALLGLQKHVRLNLLSAGIATLRNVGAALIVSFFAPTLNAFFIWQAASTIVGVLALRGSVWAEIGATAQPPRFDVARLLGVKNFALGVLGTSLLAVLLTQFDKILLAKVLPITAFAAYTLASTVATSLLQLVAPVAQSYYPRFTQLLAERSDSSLSTVYHTAAQILALAAIPAALVLALFSEKLLFLWTRNAPLANVASPLLTWLTFGVLCNGLQHIPYMLQLASGRPQIALRINLVATIVYVPVMAIVVSRFGATGAAIAWAGLNILSLAASATMTHRFALRGQGRRWLLADTLIPLLATLAAAFLLRNMWTPRGSLLLQGRTLVAIGGALTATCFLSCDVLRPRLISWIHWSATERRTPD